MLLPVVGQSKAHYKRFTGENVVRGPAIGPQPAQRLVLNAKRGIVMSEKTSKLVVEFNNPNDALTDPHPPRLIGDVPVRYVPDERRSAENGRKPTPDFHGQDDIQHVQVHPDRYRGDRKSVV